MNFLCRAYFNAFDEEIEFANELSLKLVNYIDINDFKSLFEQSKKGYGSEINNIIKCLMKEISFLTLDRIQTYLGRDYTFDDFSLNIVADGVNSKYNSLLDNCSFQKLMEDDNYLKEVVERYVNYEKES